MEMMINHQQKQIPNMRKIIQKKGARNTGQKEEKKVHERGKERLPKSFICVLCKRLMQNNKTKMLGNQKEQKTGNSFGMADISKETKNAEKCKLVTWQKSFLSVYVCALASRAVCSLALMSSIFNKISTICRLE